MIIKTFTAPDLEKALWLMVEDLGPAAIILKTRFNSERAGQPLQYIEITAALDSSLYRQDIEYLGGKSASLSPVFLRQITCEANASGQPDPTPVPEVFEVIGW
jgi:hypothetical protein